jgi:hypothetical protein
VHLLSGMREKVWGGEKGKGERILDRRKITPTEVEGWQLGEGSKGRGGSKGGK